MEETNNMVQFFKGSADPRDAAYGKLAEALGQGLGKGITTYQANKALQEVLEDEELKDAPISTKMGRLHSALSPYGEYGQRAFQNQMEIEQQAYQEKAAKEAQKEAKENQKRVFQQQKELQEQKDIAALERVRNKPPKEGARSAQPIQPEINKKIGEVLGRSKGMSADELKFAFDEERIPPADYSQYIENRRRTEEQGTKTSEEKKKALRTETLPIRSELAKKAQAAEKGIQNKQHLLDLIKRGDINDPTYAALAESLPLNLGKRLLSNDTVEYKSGLVDEFTDLRNIFQGQTRIKEIELLEEKVADLYLTDDQKEAVLKSRINALKSDIIRAEAAAELEDRDDLGVLQFNKEVEKIAKPKLEALFNQILDEQKAIIKDAENRKQLPLRDDDPDDLKIIDAILEEAGGNYKKAEQIAEKKGYKF